MLPASLLVIRIKCVVYGWQTCYIKGPESKFLGFWGHAVSVTTPQLCHHGMKAVITMCKLMNMTVFQ